jgi:hypothetical protein
MITLHLHTNFRWALLGQTTQIITGANKTFRTNTFAIALYGTLTPLCLTATCFTNFNAAIADVCLILSARVGTRCYRRRCCGGRNC